MPTFFPIESPVAFQCVNSEMKSLLWRDRGIVADFNIPQSHNVLRVQFDHVHVLRVLDEMLISTENEPGSEGLVPNHFAYRVEGSLFWSSQSEVVREANPDAKHYRFITGWTCLDVISDRAPLLTVESLI